MQAKTVAAASLLFLCLAAGPASAASGDPYMPARPDSPLVRKLLATPVPADPRAIAWVAEALTMLAQKNAPLLHSYLERVVLLAALGEPAPKAGTVEEAIALEARLPPIDEVRDRVFSTIITAELAKPADVVPEGIRANRSRYVQETPVVWQPKEQNAGAAVYYLHVVLRNAGHADVAGFRGELVLARDPEVTVRCDVIWQTSSQYPLLPAGKSLPMFCATDWQKKTSLQTLVDAARAVEAGAGTMRYRLQHLDLHGSGFDLQRFGGSRFDKRSFADMGVFVGGPRAATIVRESSCLDRGSCADEFLGGFGPLRSFAWVAFAAGIFVYLVAAAVARRIWIRATTMWIITATMALLPILGFSLLLAAGLGALFYSQLGGHLWAAFAAGLWGAWLLALPFRRRAAPQSLGR